MKADLVYRRGNCVILHFYAPFGDGFNCYERFDNNENYTKINDIDSWFKDFEVAKIWLDKYLTRQVDGA